WIFPGSDSPHRHPPRRRETLAGEPMRESMIQLSGFLGRHRRLVLAAWSAILLAAIPLAMHQTDHLTGGGFDGPGSPSKAVSGAVRDDFGSSSESIAVVLRAEPGAGDPALAAAVRRTTRTVAGVEGLSVAPRAAARGLAELRGSGTALIAVDGSGQTAD